MQKDLVMDATFIGGMILHRHYDGFRLQQLSPLSAAVPVTGGPQGVFSLPPYITFFFPPTQNCFHSEFLYLGKGKHGETEFDQADQKHAMKNT